MKAKYRHFLPPMSRIRKYFQEKVEFFDAVYLTPIQANEDTCPPTRYVVIAKKG